MKTTNYNFPFIKKQFTAEQFFMFSMVFVNAGNYLYNLLLGRILGPQKFADAAILITFLLILSFVGMAFQIVTTKYIVIYDQNKTSFFTKLMYKAALFLGFFIGFLIIFCSKYLQSIFKTDTFLMFVIFGFSVPLYFLMSVKRGICQGKNKLIDLSKTYIFEMLSRLLLTFILIFLFYKFTASILVAIGIAVSFIFGLIPVKISNSSNLISNLDNQVKIKEIASFFALTAFYEFTQIIINNSDVIMVKYFFDNTNSGLYASLALIGRVVYFVAWMFVMLLLPKVLQLKKENKNTKPILLKYVLYIFCLSASIVIVTWLFPETAILLLFGNKYLAISFLLWKYAVATSIFAIANIFAYYFLSINKYVPVVITGILGLLQIVLICLFHSSLEQVVNMQILEMSILLFFQLFFYFYQNKTAQF
ncbi:oligosaccharide flippase family protein [Flavobacterium psychrophilum]|uniref:oligosaccharide flippase family protein n=1 Tax=Flavobacterium psychrophilum TaxID=96345 RepID=UPI00106D5730|nr:oligosaccharide flippase family protein [Flavobacterium psychrophilum]